VTPAEWRRARREALRAAHALGGALAFLLVGALAGLVLAGWLL
jgi:hypothetical protein